MSGVFLLVEIDKNEPHVFAFDPQLQNAHLSGSCLSSHSAPPTSMPVMSTTPDTPTASKITFPTAAGSLFRTSSGRTADRMKLVLVHFKVWGRTVITGLRLEYCGARVILWCPKKVS